MTTKLIIFISPRLDLTQSAVMPPSSSTSVKFSASNQVNLCAKFKLFFNIYIFLYFYVFLDGSAMECVTCSLDSQVSEGGVDGALGHCGWVSIRRNCENCDEGMTFIVSCAGNKVPQNYRYQPIL